MKHVGNTAGDGSSDITVAIAMLTEGTHGPVIYVPDYRRVLLRAPSGGLCNPRRRMNEETAAARDGRAGDDQSVPELSQLRRRRASEGP